MARECGVFARRGSTARTVLLSAAPLQTSADTIIQILRQHQTKPISHIQLKLQRHAVAASALLGWSRCGWTKFLWCDAVWCTVGRLAWGLLVLSSCRRIFMNVSYPYTKKQRQDLMCHREEIFSRLHALAHTMFFYDNSKEYKSFLGRGLVRQGCR